MLAEYLEALIHMQPKLTALEYSKAKDELLKSDTEERMEQVYRMALRWCKK